MEKRKKIVLIRDGALGDTIVTIPVIRVLNSVFRNAEIYFIGNSYAGPLLVDAGLVAKCSSTHERWTSALYSPTGERVTRECIEKVGSPDLVIAFSSDEDGSMRKHLTSLFKCDIIVHLPLPEDSYNAHISDHLLSALPPDWDLTQSEVSLTPSQESEQSADDWLTKNGLMKKKVPEKFLVVHPGSGSPKKNWPWQRFGEVAGLALNRGLCVVVRIGPVEEERLAVDGCSLWPDTVPLRGESLAVVGAVIARAWAFLGSDSGISHLAAAVGCRTFSLFGPTESRLWGPRGDDVHIIDGGGRIEDVLVDTVAELLFEL